MLAQVLFENRELLPRVDLATDFRCCFLSGPCILLLQNLAHGFEKFSGVKAYFRLLKNRDSSVRAKCASIALISL
jgi:hypothetical protein